MVTVLTELIDKQDNSEIIRDQIGAILLAESVSQQVLAVAEPDPLLWKLRVYTEAQNTIEAFTNEPEEAIKDPSPVVNVWYEGGSFDPAIGDTVKRQAQRGTFNVDIYGFAIAAEDGTGHKPGDREASFTAQRGARLVRNILMSALNIQLQLRPMVWQRWIASLTNFQVELQTPSALQVVALRVSLHVTFNEYSPQFAGDTLEFLAVDVKRDSDGMLISELDIDYTA